MEEERADHVRPHARDGKDRRTFEEPRDRLDVVSLHLGHLAAARFHLDGLDDRLRLGLAFVGAREKAEE
eukprot:2367112-Prymnesium_polylepis.1